MGDGRWKRTSARSLPRSWTQSMRHQQSPSGNRCTSRCRRPDASRSPTLHIDKFLFAGGRSMSHAFPQKVQVYRACCVISIYNQGVSSSCSFCRCCRTHLFDLLTEGSTVTLNDRQARSAHRSSHIQGSTTQVQQNILVSSIHDYHCPPPSSNMSKE